MMNAFAETLGRLGLSPYPEQMLMVERLEHDGPLGMISMVEAPPATGKTMVAAWRSLSIARDTGDKVLIAVPTISVMRQTIEAVKRMAETSFPGIRVASVYGRQEFVHERAARTWISGMCAEALPAYDRWAETQDQWGGHGRASTWRCSMPDTT